MIVVDTCDVPFRLPPIAFGCPTFTSARLERHGLPDIALTLDGDNRLGPLPPTIRTGVWRLWINTPCGCYVTSINIHCPNPEFVATHPDNTEHADPEC